ncbi:T9SS type A sorting domain-containing protein, partial [Algibacter sp.]|nr:T9SS type A sorting domain-containing protein [Algibacter sp.]
SGNASVKLNSDKTVDKITVVTISGQKIATHYKSNIIDVSRLANGIYFINIEVDHQIVTKKLIVKK